MAENDAPDQPTGSQLEQGPLDPVGQRAWLAQVDRKVGTRTYAGAAAVVLALAAAIVAIVLAIDVRDNSATKGELERLERRIGVVAEGAGQAEDLEQRIEALDGRIGGLEGRIEDLSGDESGLEDRLEVIEDDLEALRNQISDLDEE